MIYKNIRNKFSNVILSFLNLKDESYFARRFLVSGYRFLYSLMFTIEKKLLILKNRLRYGKLYFNKIYWVNPKKIQYVSKTRVNKWYDYSRIIDGDWDHLTIPFEDSFLYQAFKQRFKEGKKWEDTEYYQKVLNNRYHGRSSYNNIEKCDEKFRKLDLLYYEIKKNGYKLKRELSSSIRGFKRFDVQTILDDISVDIGRDGQILIEHGKNRLSIVKLLDIPKIPINIIKRHKKWMEFRNNIKFFFRNHQFEKHNQVLTHPDLQNIPFKQGEIPFTIIRENISISKGTLLDIGANLGYFCHKFEDEGFICCAVEENQIFGYLLKKLKSVENKKFKIILGPIFNYKKNQEITFDVVLALNIFHHFLKREDTYLDLVKFLKRLKVKELIFGAHNPRDFRNKNFYRNYKPDQFVNFILENSCLNKAKFIGKTKTGRSLYKLTSESSSL